MYVWRDPRSPGMSAETVLPGRLSQIVGQGHPDPKADKARLLPAPVPWSGDGPFAEQHLLPRSTPGRPGSGITGGTGSIKHRDMGLHHL
jgi:hypothetical protein